MKIDRETDAGAWLVSRVRELARKRLRGDVALRNLAARSQGVCEELVADAVRDVVCKSTRLAHTPCSDPLALGAAYESILMLEPEATASGEFELKPVRSSTRKKRGAYYTPGWLVEHVLDVALEPLIRGADESALLNIRVLDPACGSGHFLIGAAERLATKLAQVRAGGVLPTGAVRRGAFRDVGRRCLFGMDSDPVAVEICRAAVAHRCGDTPGMASRIVCADGLLDAAPLAAFDAVIGNPPFLNRLETHTAVTGSMGTRLKGRFGAAARAYTDLSALFLLRSVHLTRPGGRMALVQPQSVLSARDAAGVRAEVLQRATWTDLWLGDEHTFDASVFVCVPAFRVAENKQGPVNRRIGEQFRRLPPGTLRPDPDDPGGSWGHMLAWDVPDAALRSESTIGDFAVVTADFRDEYYGLRGSVVEDRTVPHSRRARFPGLITTGLIEPARCEWGSVPCRFDGRRWDAPRVDLDRLRKNTGLGAWATSRLRPKLLLATQTRTLEVAVDERGQWLPVTPLISILPRRSTDLWLIGAALASPVLSALGARLGAGSAMTHKAIKLSAAQVRRLPLPPRSAAWSEGGRLFRQASGTGGVERLSLLTRAAQATCRAYGLDAAASKPHMDWWAARLLPPRAGRL